MFHASESQLFNGQANVGLTENEAISTSEIISMNDLINNANHTYTKVIKLSESLRYSVEGYIPKLNYDGVNKLLPNQTDILIKDINPSGLQVTEAIIVPTNRVIVLRILNPNNYLITDLGVDKLKVHYVTQNAQGVYEECNIQDASSYENGVTRIWLQYDDAKSQDHCHDSYVLNRMSYYNVANSGLESSGVQLMTILNMKIIG